MTTDEEKYFALGAGRLYIAPASVTGEEARSLLYYAGPTRGGVTVSYSARIHEITDYSGALIRSLRYGERVRAEGKLSRLYPRAVSAAIGAPLTGGVLALGGTGGRGRLARVRVVLVCALPEETGGGEFVFSMLATASSGLCFSLSPERDSSVSFSLQAETDGAGLSGRLVFA